MARVLIFCLLLFCVSTKLLAHDLGVAQIIVEDQSQGVFLLQAKLSTKVDPVAPLLPAHCRLQDSSRSVLSRLTQTVSWQFSCDDNENSALTVVLPWQREGAMVSLREAGQENAFQYVSGRNGDVHITLASEPFQISLMAVFGQYLWLGVEHILSGLDHLAFVLALCLIAVGWRLVKLVTAFTIGHSLTLCLGALGWVQIPIAPVEVCIALSIAFVARAAIKGDDGGHGFWLVLAFGLLHGLGFASALAEIDTPQNLLLLALLAFNLGVELGQLLFIALVSLCVLAWRQRLTPAPMAKPLLGFAIGGMGMFWVVERISILFI